MKNAVLDQEWCSLQRKLLCKEFMDEVESIMQLHEVKQYSHGDTNYSEWEIPQEMVSLTTDPMFRTSTKYLFTGLFQWKDSKKKGMIAKQIILFSAEHNSCAVFDLFQS